jgi:hypothetical protein
MDTDPTGAAAAEREQPERNQIFISYSHKDSEWLDKLLIHLRPFVRKRRINVWTDRESQAGANWREEIQTALDSAKVAVLLVSPNFLASDFITDNELPPLLQAAQRKDLQVIWIPVSASAYIEAGIGEYTAVNKPPVPLDRLSPAEQNDELVKIAAQISNAFASVPDDLHQRLSHGGPAHSCAVQRTSRLEFLYWGTLGGLVAGLIIALPYKLQWRNSPDVGWVRIVAAIVYSAVVGCAGTRFVHYFMEKTPPAVNHARSPVVRMLLDARAGAFGGVITSILAGLFAALPFGMTGNAPEIQPEILMLAVAIGTIFISTSVLRSDMTPVPASLVSAVCAATPVVCMLMSLFVLPSLSKPLEHYFAISDPVIMVRRALLIALGIGSVVGLQVGVTRQVHRFLF